MGEKNGYPPGHPSWVDISGDVEAVKGFYGAVFGWGAQQAGPPGPTGGYGFFTKAGKMVAGFAPKTDPGPPSWVVYFATEDADATVAKAEAAGASVVSGPTDVMEEGRMAVLRDPTGAIFSVWQEGNHRGAELAGEPGALVWVELNTRDTAGATTFYRQVFGWSSEPSEEMAYTQFAAAGQQVAGMMAMPSEVPAEHPAYWLAYFGTADVDATVGAAKSAGADVLAGPMDIPGAGGRFAVLRDPQGAAFGVFQGPS